MNAWVHLKVGDEHMGPMTLESACERIQKWLVLGRLDAFIMDAFDRPVTSLLRRKSNRKQQKQTSVNKHETK